jgi:RNA polymerase sigma factor (sigma-70 family)
MHTVEYTPQEERHGESVGGQSNASVSEALLSSASARKPLSVYAVPGAAALYRPERPRGPLGAESDLIDGVRAGDPEAMAVLYERHREPGLRFIRGLMSGVQEAEDVFHEGFTKAVAAIRNGYGPTDVFGAYLNTSIRSVAATFWMKNGREQPVPDEDLDPGPVEDPRLETALSLFEHEKVAAAMRSLPERWRIVLWHAEVLGEPPRDIAPLLGIGANAVSALLIRARAGLRAAYEQQSLVNEPGISTQEEGARA